MHLTTRTIGEIGNVGSRMLRWAAPQNAQDITLNSRAQNFEGVVITDMWKPHTTMCARSRAVRKFIHNPQPTFEKVFVFPNTFVRVVRVRCSKNRTLFCDHADVSNDCCVIAWLNATNGVKTCEPNSCWVTDGSRTWPRYKEVIKSTIRPC
jgi:hypothetical protein